MSSKNTHDDDDHGAAPRGATTIHATKSGNGAKWLVGALAAVLVAGGGYLAWKNMPAQPADSTQSAYNDTSSSTPSDTAQHSPFDTNDPTQNATSGESAEQNAAAAPASTTTRATTHTRRTSTQTASIPEETIGVTPASVSTDEGVEVRGHRSVWARIPNAQRLASFYPERARTFDREGEATLHCTVLDGGYLSCAKVSETPRGDFGRAAMQIAHQLRHTETLADGRDATGSELNLHVMFRLDDGERTGRG